MAEDPCTSNRTGRVSWRYSRIVSDQMDCTYSMNQRPRYRRETGLCELPYEAVRTASDPDAMLLEFWQRVYDVTAELGRWDRFLLEGGRPAR